MDKEEGNNNPAPGIILSTTTFILLIVVPTTRKRNVVENTINRWTGRNVLSSSDWFLYELHIYSREVSCRQAHERRNNEPDTTSLPWRFVLIICWTNLRIDGCGCGAQEKEREECCARQPSTARFPFIRNHYTASTNHKWKRNEIRAVGGVRRFLWKDISY